MKNYSSHKDKKLFCKTVSAKWLQKNVRSDCGMSFLDFNSVFITYLQILHDTAHQLDLNSVFLLYKLFYVPSHSAYKDSSCLCVNGNLIWLSNPIFFNTIMIFSKKFLLGFPRWLKITLAPEPHFPKKLLGQHLHTLYSIFLNLYVVLRIESSFCLPN